MNKVTTINLNGNAYQLEEAGYELLKKYMEQARRNLADDPDKDEILADFERAIAEKCDGYLHVRKSVIGEKEVQKIIDDMGPVEPAEEAEHEAKSAVSEQRPRRLYALRDGAIIGGVANGIAAFFNIDVTIVRLLFVVFAFASIGLAIFVYILLMLILPVAETPEQRAELRGERFSAQDVLDRAKKKYSDIGSKEHWQKVAEDSQPALSDLGQILQKIVRCISVCIGICIGLLLAALTAAWISALWWLGFGHLHLTDQLSTISLWTVAFGASAAYFIAALPLGVLTATFIRLGSSKPFGKQNGRWLVAIAALWVVAIGVAIGVAAVTSGRISDYQSNHGYVTIDKHKICINRSYCPDTYNTGPKPFPPFPPMPPQTYQQQVVYPYQAN
jgi:phage shock protein PspC (stress-responsive transcriptional regulator)